jgi:ketosteroid isomerase-like protein
MSRENVEIVRQMYAAFIEGDYPTSLNLLHPEVEWHGNRGGLDGGKPRPRSGGCWLRGERRGPSAANRQVQNRRLCSISEVALVIR